MKIDLSICRRCLEGVMVRPRIPLFSGEEEDFCFGMFDEYGCFSACFRRTPKKKSEESPWKKVFDLKMRCMNCDSETMTVGKMNKAADAYVEEYVSSHDDFELENGCKFFLEQHMMSSQGNS